MKWPAGIRAGVASCGIKSAGSDLGIIVADEPSAWAGVFTQNAAAAAPVRWSVALQDRSLKAIVANSGNANACTGKAGDEAVASTARAAGAAFGCDPHEVAIASTGPIGVELPVKPIVAGIARCSADLTSDPLAFAGSIMTTDTGPKLASAKCGSAGIVGVAKGAAMIAPNMATMLAFITTDALVAPSTMREALQRAADKSFNRISIDGCESTNDSVFLLATGRSNRVTAEELSGPLEDVCRDLARQIAADAEGSSRWMRISIAGANSDDAAVSLGRAVAGSALWRAAVAGGDPNWGRVLAAIGSIDRALDLAEVEVSIGAELVFDRGEPCGSLDAAAKQMQSDVVEVTCRVGKGEGRAEVLSAELSVDYVKLNAAGTT